jgi:hypothetical protein
MTGTKYIGMDVHKESISIAVRNDAGKLVMECVIKTKANVILDFIHGLRGESQVTFVASRRICMSWARTTKLSSASYGTQSHT